MCAAVVERVQPAVQPWKPKSRQRPSCQDSPDSSSTKALESAPGSPVTDQSIVESPSAGLTPAKHPLQNRWSMWYFKNDKAKEWKDNHKLIASCDTIEVSLCLSPVWRKRRIDWFVEPEVNAMHNCVNLSFYLSRISGLSTTS